MPKTAEMHFVHKIGVFIQRSPKCLNRQIYQCKIATKSINTKHIKDMRTRSFDPSDFEEFFDAKELESMMNGMHITRFGEYRDDDTEEYKQTGTRKKKKNSKQAMETAASLL